MIFNVPGHIDMIRNGVSDPHFQELPTFPKKLIPEVVIKTQTRRLNRGIYQVGKSYAVQRKRGVKAEPDIRIVMDRIWEEHPIGSFLADSGETFAVFTISKEDARAEGGYIPILFEDLFHKLNPKFNGWSRWAFAFHVVKVLK